MTRGFEANNKVTIDAPQADVWDALTNPANVKEYMHGTENEGFSTNPIWFTDGMYTRDIDLQKHLLSAWAYPVSDRNHFIGHREHLNGNWTAWVAAFTNNRIPPPPKTRVFPSASEIITRIQCDYFPSLWRDGFLRSRLPTVF